MKIAIIPCHNGLGHIHRLNILANYFKKKKLFKIDFFLNKAKKIKKNNSIKYLNKKIPSNYFYYLKSNHKKLFKKIKLNFYNIVISDNFYEFPKVKKLLVILHANFFWFQIKKNSKVVKNFNTNLKNETLIFTNYIFSMINLKKLKIKKIGFFGSFRGELERKGKYILISNGTARPDLIVVKKIIDRTRLYYPNSKIFLDNFIFDKLKLNYSNIFPGEFDDKMYKKIKFAIIRPGFGTIVECLRFAIPLICINLKSNSKNLEIRHNSNIVEDKRFGFNLKNLEKLKMILIKINKVDKKLFIKKCKKLKWESEKIIYDETLKKYKKVF